MYNIYGQVFASLFGSIILWCSSIHDERFTGIEMMMKCSVYVMYVGLVILR